MSFVFKPQDTEAWKGHINNLNSNLL